MSSEMSTKVEILVSLFLVGGAGGGPAETDDSGLVSDDLLEVRLCAPPLFLLRLLDFDNASLFYFLRASSSSFCC